MQSHLLTQDQGEPKLKSSTTKLRALLEPMDEDGSKQRDCQKLSHNTFHNRGARAIEHYELIRSKGAFSQSPKRQSMLLSEEETPRSNENLLEPPSF